MSSFDEMIKTGLDDLADQAPHHHDLVAVIHRRSRYRRAVRWAPATAVLAVLLMAAGILWIRPGQGGPASAPTACAPVTTAVLPTWARAGFSDPTPSAPYVASQSGRLLAILFGNPLQSPTPNDHSNKILWVTSGSSPVSGPADHGKSGFDLQITGALEGGTGEPGQTMRAIISGGPGPSIVDVPVPGCWHLELKWGNQHDTIDLAYSPG